MATQIDEVFAALNRLRNFAVVTRDAEISQTVDYAEMIIMEKFLVTTREENPMETQSVEQEPGSLAPQITHIPTDVSGGIFTPTQI